MSRFNADSAELDLRTTGMGEARAQPQTLFFKAATGNAFTMVRAGFAFKFTMFRAGFTFTIFKAVVQRVMTTWRCGRNAIRITIGRNLGLRLGRIESPWSH